MRKQIICTAHWVAVISMVLVGGLTPASLADTCQDFDDPGDIPAECTLGLEPPMILPGGPTGNFLRLVSKTGYNANSISFDLTDAGRFSVIEAEFDFRITPELFRADGLGFALLNTAWPDHGTSGPICGGFEEPNFALSLGVGFDIFTNDEDFGGEPDNNLGDINNNHVSIHFNGSPLTQVDATPVVDLAGGEWIHAKIIMRPGGGFSEVTVILTPSGGSPYTLIDSFPVPAFDPYEGRVHFGARAGNTDHDLDNICVRFLQPFSGPGTLAFGSDAFAAVEGDDTTAFISVTRIDGMDGPVSVDYSTADGSAIANVDYAPKSGTLAFVEGQTLATFTVPILDDHAPEDPDETFSISLSNPTGGAMLGTPSSTTVTIRDTDDDPPQLVGEWSNSIELGLVAVHMNLLPDGKVIYWEDRGDIDEVRLWEPPPIGMPGPGTISVLDPPGYDIFCVGHSFLPDGKLFVTGGHSTLRNPDGIGLEKAAIFDSVAGAWDTTVPDMNGRRWYPTNTTLANGDALVVSGSLNRTFHPNPLAQVYQAASNTWRDLGDARLPLPLYPFMFLAPNGQVFNAGPQKTTRYLDTSGTGAWTFVAKSNFGFRDYGSAVIYDGNVLILGGTDDRARLPNALPTPTTEVIDLNAANPSWNSTSSMAFGRRHQNATFLPDGKVLVTGGTSATGFNNAIGAVLAPEIWDPDSETWTILRPNQVPRLYHSSSLLLPDGRVVSAGGGQPAADGEIDNTDAEICSLPYLFDENGEPADRPTINRAPTILTYGQSFCVQTPDAASITKVTLIRLCSATHAFDQNQRFAGLDVFSLESGFNGPQLNVIAPSDPNLAPPGHYMLFILAGGVPSVAKILRLGFSECIADLDADGTVGPFDLALLLGNWGPCPEPCKPGDPGQSCPADFDGDCIVGAFDLALLLGNWGPCE